MKGANFGGFFGQKGHKMSILKTLLGVELRAIL